MSGIFIFEFLSEPSEIRISPSYIVIFQGKVTASTCLWVWEKQDMKTSIQNQRGANFIHPWSRGSIYGTLVVILKLMYVSMVVTCFSGTPTEISKSLTVPIVDA